MENAVFPLWRIGLSALVATLTSIVVLLLWWSRVKAGYSVGEALRAAIVVGVSVLIWRLVGNVGVLNDDPVPLFSPNDLLCPLVTYVLLGLDRAFEGNRSVDWERRRAVLVLVSWAVNVVTI